MTDCEATRAECHDLWDYPATPLPASTVVCEAEIDTATGTIGPAVARAP